MRVFFDLDPAVYMAGFAAQKKIYTVVFENEYGMFEKSFEDGNEKNAWLREISSEEYDGPAIEILDEEPHLVVEEESHALQAAKTVIDSCIKAIERKFKQPVEDAEYFLTGAGNFREGLATIAPYKGNRTAPKPVHYQAIRDYYIDNWGAYVVEGMEADDEVSIRIWEEYLNGDEDIILCTIDKDLDQIPGWHYDYKKHVFYEVDPLDGELFFFAQILAGDATDNIKGCYRIGIEKAKQLVNEVFDEFIGEQNWRRHVWDMIVWQYTMNMEKYPDKYPEGMTAEEAAIENARLVYMLKEHGELWTPPRF